MALPARKQPQQGHDEETDHDPDQAWYWTPEWQAKERQADEDKTAGRYEEFPTMEDFIADLMSEAEDEDAESD